jgi:hypothetical protein
VIGNRSRIKDLQQVLLLPPVANCSGKEIELRSSSKLCPVDKFYGKETDLKCFQYTSYLCAMKSTWILVLSVSATAKPCS